MKGSSNRVLLKARQTIRTYKILLHINGLSLRTIARLIHVTATAVLKWAKQYTLENHEKPQPKSNTTAVVVELDDVWHYLQRKKQALNLKSILSLCPSTP
jgi:predicted transcriptional regulator